MKRAFIVVAAGLVFALPAWAATTPTIEASPATVGMLSQVSLSGNTGGTKRGQTVFVEAKECRTSFFRVVAATASASGGSWATSAPMWTTTTYRARVGKVYSRPTLVRKRVVLAIEPLPKRIFMIKAFSGGPLVGRTVRIERYTKSGWVLMQRAKLRQSDIFGVVETTVRIRRKGMRVRAFVAASQAAPCFVAGASKIVTT